MKLIVFITLLAVSRGIFAGSLPAFSLQPTNQAVSAGSTATFVASATGAASYQWRFNGVDISGATGATLAVINAQPTNSGYYLVIAKNDTGWVPSQMAWLSVIHSNGIVPFSNLANPYFSGQAISQMTFQPINGSAQVMAGPALDQMSLIGGRANKAAVTNGYFDYAQIIGYDMNFNPIINTNLTLPSVEAGRTVYYAVYITYTNSGIAYTQASTVMSLVAGGNGYPVPATYGLKFPAWPEWPEPWLISSPPTNQIRVPGETITFGNNYLAYADFGTPAIRWRKDGNNLPNATNFTWTEYSYSGQTAFTITNLQPSDTGVYDAEIFGNDWEDGPKIYLSVQTTNGQGVFQNPKFLGPNFVCGLVGAAGRNYDVQCSSNLFNWSDLVTLSNLTGTVMFTNPPAAVGAQFYRTVLAP